MLVAIPLITPAAVHQYCVCDNGHGDVFYGYKIVVYGLLLICGVRSFWEIAREGPVGHVSCYSGQ
jgi:hypothetical protein